MPSLLLLNAAVSKQRERTSSANLIGHVSSRIVLITPLGVVVGGLDVNKCHVRLSAVLQAGMPWRYLLERPANAITQMHTCPLSES